MVYDIKHNYFQFLGQQEESKTGEASDLIDAWINCGALFVMECVTARGGVTLFRDIVDLPWPKERQRPMRRPRKPW